VANRLQNAPCPTHANRVSVVPAATLGCGHHTSEWPRIAGRRRHPQATHELAFRCLKEPRHILPRVGGLPLRDVVPAVVASLSADTASRRSRSGGRLRDATLLAVLAYIDASQEMVDMAGGRLGDHARVWREDGLDLVLDEPVDVVVSTATLHWVPDHDRLWQRLAAALRSGGILEIQCSGQGNLDCVREVIDAVAAESFPELEHWPPWVFAGPQETRARLEAAGSTTVRCWLEERRTRSDDSPASYAHRSSPRTWRACPRNAVSRSLPPLSSACANRWTTSASTSRPSGSGAAGRRSG
jgi:SAM-dependent methyltransferase